MGRSRKIGRTILLTVAVILDLLAIAIRTTRLPRSYSDWLGQGHPFEAPIRKFGYWTQGHIAPRTPGGFLSVFEPVDLLVTAGLLFVLTILLILLAMTWAGQAPPLLAGIRRRISWPPPVHFRVRTALVLVAIVGLELGWEINGWKTWRQREGNFGTLVSGAEMEAAFKNRTRTLRREIAEFDPSPSAEERPGEVRTKAAIAADLARQLDQMKCDLATIELMTAQIGREVRKEECAAAGSRVRGKLDPQRESDAHDLLRRRGYRRDLDALKDEVRRFPDHWKAHRLRAWILATDPDATLRDGKAAVESATLACELTRWKSVVRLDTLAASYAEAGDFPAAVTWEKNALEHIGSGSPFSLAANHRLTLYQAAKPYREEK